MRKTLLALVVMFHAHSATAYQFINNETAYLDVYGEIKARAFFYENIDNDYSFGDSKLGIDARYAVTDTTRLIGLVEGEVKWDIDETLDQDELSFSKHYVGVDHEVLGMVTYGKHATASDDLGGVDYSEAFGGVAELNPISQHDSGIKYNYSSDFFAIASVYGDEDGDFNRDLFELYGQYVLGSDIKLRAGYGQSSTNLPSDKQKDTYMMAAIEMLRGDFVFGASYYNLDTEDKLDSISDIESNSIALAVQMEVIEKLFAYAGYEFINQDSDNARLDGDRTVIYVGTRYQLFDWASLFAELGLNDNDISSTDSTNFALGATVTF